MEGVTDTKSWKLPKCFYQRPVVILDSGSSVDESIFLERMRKWLLDTLSDHMTKVQPRVWLLYAHPSQMLWHGSVIYSQYDEWEVRPIRQSGKNLSSPLETMVAFEEGCRWKRIKSPWREYVQSNGRATLIYPNPSAREMRWANKQRKRWKGLHNIADLHVGQPSSRSMPADFVSFISSVACYDDEGMAKIRDALGGYFAYRVPWEHFWEKSESGPRVAVADNWGSTYRQRHVGMGKVLGETLGMGDPHISQRNIWEEVDVATSSEYYIVATRREGVLFDVMLAISRGCTIVAPDVPCFRRLPGKKVLWPARVESDGSFGWTFHEARTWVQQHGHLQRRRHEGRKPR